jgi:preprotein translocase subunit SecF
MQILHNTNYDFIRWRWHALILSSVLIIGGLLYALLRHGIPLGIDFSGGTMVVLQFDQAVHEDQVRKALDAVPGDKVVQKYGEDAAHQILIRLPEVTDAEKGFSLEQGARSTVEALQKAGLPHFQVISTEVVGPIAGADLQSKGIWVTVVSILCLTAYIALRFRFIFAIGAIIATFHDIFIVFTMLALFKYELSLNIVAAILTITGYSVNDTIVIFDRVRENARLLRREPLDKVVNLSVNQTLGRTVITSGVTLLSVLALYLFGGEVLRGFAFAMLVGVISGTYSTVFIAATIAIILSGRKASAGRAAMPVEEAVERPRRTGGGRNVRVS